MKRMTSVLAVATAAILGLSACGGGSDPLDTSSPAASGSASGGGAVVIGSADFPESELLAEIYAGALNAKGIDASTKPRIGSREIYLKALEDGSIQAVPEYTGALGFFYDKGFAETDPEKVYTAVQELLPEDFTMLEKSAAEDNDSIVVTKETADSQQVDRIPAAGPGRIQIMGGRGGQRVDRRAVGPHRRREDSSHHQAREPGGEVIDDERREKLVALHVLRREPGGPDGDPDEQKQRELKDDHDAGSDQRDPGIPKRAGREESLHDQVIGPVRGRREQRTTKEATQQGVGPGEIDGRIDHSQFVGAGRRREDRGAGAAAGRDPRGGAL